MHVNVMILLEVKIKYLASNFWYVACVTVLCNDINCFCFSERMFSCVILP